MILIGQVIQRIHGLKHDMPWHSLMLYFLIHILCQLKLMKITPDVEMRSILEVLTYHHKSAAAKTSKK